MALVPADRRPWYAQPGYQLVAESVLRAAQSAFRDNYRTRVDRIPRYPRPAGPPRPPRPNKRQRTGDGDGGGPPPGRKYASSSNRRRVGKRYRKIGRRVRKSARRTKRKPVPSFSRMGVTLRHETGGSITAPNVVYFGHHDAPIQMVWKAFGQALVKKIMNIAKLSFVSWDDVPLDGVMTNFNMVVRYKDVIDQNVGTVTITAAAVNSTYNDLAITISDVLLNLITTSQNRMEFLDFYVKNQSSTTAIMPSIRLRAADMRVTMMSKSLMKYQNLTENTNITTDLAAVYSTNDIRNNPVNGMSYYKTGSYMMTKYYAHNGVTNPPVFIGDNVNGVVAFDASDVDFTPAMARLLKNPPTKEFFDGRVTVSKVSVSPGDIKTSLLMTRKSFTLNTFVATFLYAGRIANSVSGLSSAIKVPQRYGKIRVFGLEKRLDVRTDEPSTKVAFELDIEMNMMISGSQPAPTQPFNDY